MDQTGAMTVLVDECRWPFRGRLWCHLVSDSSYDELHAFASRLGKPRVAFQGDHYDLHHDDRSRALALGAMATDARDLVRRLIVAGLRRGPALSRRGLAGVSHLPVPELMTPRLRLRQWKERDRPPFRLMCADPEAMRFLGGVTHPIVADACVDAHAVRLALRGVGMWAVERIDNGAFVGSVGLDYALFEAPFAPAIDLVCHLRRDYWGNGLAVESSAAVIRYGFDILELNEIVAFTSPHNVQSLAVMARLGMHRSAADDFVHPFRALFDEYRDQVLYRVLRPPAG